MKITVYRLEIDSPFEEILHVNTYSSKEEAEKNAKEILLKENLDHCGIITPVIVSVTESTQKVEVEEGNGYIFDHPAK